ncbi:MAG: hypothetical protein RR553_09810 [Akkermansia sp.]
MNQTELAKGIIKANGVFCGKGVSGLRTSFLLWAYLHEGRITNMNELAKELYASRQGVVFLSQKMEDLVRIEWLNTQKHAVEFKVWLTERGGDLVERVLAKSMEEKV